MLAATSNLHVSPRRQAFCPIGADILATSESDDTAWVWGGYVPQGGLVLFCAPPKTGKSTLAYHLAGAVSEGRPFLGQPAAKSPVLILAVEERRQDAANRARALGLGGDVYIHCGPLRADAIPAIASFVVEKRIGLIIVDTLPRFWVLDNENDASKVGMAMEGIMALARETKAGVFLLYHLRKSPGSGDGEEIRGSGDIFAYVDVALIMRRRKGQSNQRTVKSFSRYDATPEEVVIALEDGEYVHLGDSATVREQETDTMLLEALSVEPRTPEQIKADADLKLAPRTLQRHYNRLADDNRCMREGSSTKALPYRYKILAATTNTVVVSDWQESSGAHPPADTEPQSEQLGMDIATPAANADGLVAP
ncbi:MAG: AAA family ATPase [Chloroflexi bacterium]|nr:AAA family ATPase [Chloroflexota bacterium]